MSYLPMSGLTMVDEDQAPAEVAEIYDEIKRELQVPLVPNMMKALANSPAAVAIHWNILRTFYKYTSLPESLSAMLFFAIAVNNQCEYCSANNELTCRTLGIDEATLTTLVDDLKNISPQRVQAIIEFALIASKNPKNLTLADFERVRQHGVTDEELVEIIIIAAIGNYGDTLADALKIEVEPMVTEALER